MKWLAWLVAIVGCGGGGGGATSNQARVTAKWTLRDLATNTLTGCPAGFDTAALYNQPIDASNHPVGNPVIDLFACAAAMGVSAPLARTGYLTWIAITNHDNTATYAMTVSQVVDVTLVDQTYLGEILNDGGYFQLAWTLVGARTGNPLSCAAAGAAGGVEVIGTDVASSTNTTSTVFPCGDGTGLTDGYRAATYAVSVGALNAATQPIGTAPAVGGLVIRGQNQVTDLGTIAIPIAGM